MATVKPVFSKDFFVKKVPNLGINANHDFQVNAEYLVYPIDEAVIKYNNHSSIFNYSFSFQHISKEKNDNNKYFRL